MVVTRGLASPRARKHLEERGAMETNKTASQTTRVKDPVCGMMVDPATARGGSFEHDGTTYYFCNPKCNERFQGDPGKYLDPNYKPGGSQHCWT